MILEQNSADGIPNCTDFATEDKDWPLELPSEGSEYQNIEDQKWSLQLEASPAPPAGPPEMKPEPIASGSSPTKKVLKQFTPKQYRMLMDRFKQEATLTEESLNQIVQDTRLEPSLVTWWFEKQQKNLRTLTIDSILQKLSKNWPPSKLVDMEKAYRKCASISVSKSVALSSRLDQSRTAILLWFKYRRIYELFKCHSDQSAGPMEWAHFIIDKEDLDNTAACYAASQTLSQQPASSRNSEIKFLGTRSEQCVKKIPRNSNTESEMLISYLAEQFQKPKEDVREWFIGESENAEAVESSEKPTLNTNRLQNSDRRLMFNVFKRSPYASPIILAEITAQSNLTHKRIRAWFAQMRRRLYSNLVSQSKHCNQGLTDDEVKVLEEEFQIHPFEEEETRILLATRLKLTRGAVKKWFLSRRDYELLVHAMPKLNSSRYNLSEQLQTEPNEDDHRTGNSGNVSSFKEKTDGVQDIPSQKLRNSDGISTDEASDREDSQPIYPSLCQLMDDAEELARPCGCKDGTQTGTNMTEAVDDKDSVEVKEPEVFDIDSSSDIENWSYDEPQCPLPVVISPVHYPKIEGVKHYFEQLDETVDQTHVASSSPLLECTCQICSPPFEDVQYDSQKVLCGLVENVEETSVGSSGPDLPAATNAPMPLIDQDPFYENHRGTDPAEASIASGAESSSAGNHCEPCASTPAKRSANEDKNHKSKKMKLSLEQSQTLRRAYRNDPQDFVQKALTLANTLSMSVEDIKSWYERRRLKKLKRLYTRFNIDSTPPSSKKTG